MKRNQHYARFLLGALVSAGTLCRVFAENTNTTDNSTNRAQIVYDGSTYFPVEFHKYDTWNNTFAEKMYESSKIAFSDRFGPFTQVGWQRRYNRDHYGIFEDFNSAGTRVVSDIFAYSFRETAVAYFDLDSLAENMSDHIGSYIVRLATGSIGNTAEEQISVDKPYSEAESSFVRDALRDGLIQYGIRFGSSSYVYLRLNGGRYQSQPLWILESRLKYTAFRRERIEEMLYVPLSYGWQVRCSAAVSPSRLYSDDPDKWATSLALSHTFARNHGAVYAGFVQNSQGPHVGMGLSLSW